MPLRLVLGVSRSGTTLLGRLMATTSTRARFVHELCPGIPNRIPSRRFMVEPGDAATIARVREALGILAAGGSPFDEAQAHRIERDDPDAEILLVKDVHSLLVWPEILESLPDWRAVVVTRDTLRVLDSYLVGHLPAQRHYLVEEHALVSEWLRGQDPPAPVARAAARLPSRVARHLRRPRLLTSELFRQAAVTELIVGFLRGWVADDDRVTHVAFEDLCRDPVAESTRLLDFLGLKHDDGSLAEIRRTTTGKSDAYYATDKDSRAVAEQPFRILTPLQRRRLARFLGGH